MKRILLILCVTLSLNGFSQQKNPIWYTDANQAANLSLQSGKPMFLFFTGSDWCGWCKKLVAEVFDKKEFKKWANQNVILVELDFPKRKQISSKLQKQNSTLARQFGVRGYPTGYFVTPYVVEKEIRFSVVGSPLGYVRGGPNNWILEAEKRIENTK